MSVGTALGWSGAGAGACLRAGGVGLRAAAQEQKARQGARRAEKGVPAAAALSMRLASSRAASVLAMMLSSGFPLEQALEMVPLVSAGQEAAGEIAQIREKMGEGVSFSDALTGGRLFDEIHRQMLRMGIAAGREDQVMAKIAETYEQQAEEGISDLVSIIEPTMVAALSIVIGAVPVRDDADGRDHFQYSVRAKEGLRVKTGKHTLCARPRADACRSPRFSAARVAAVQQIGASSESMEERLVLDAVRSAALTCYAVEGAYPQSLEALKHGYGLAYNEDAYIVVYDAFASNVMPDIQVLRKGAERP